MTKTMTEKINAPLVSLIISVYNRDDFLRLVLTSIEKQSCQDFELIVAEDGQHDAIARVVEEYSLQSKLSIKRLSQEDKGFRKNKILNQAVCASQGKILLFIDGDCILHNDYIATMLKYVKKGVCVFGRRVMLDEQLSKQLLSVGKVGKLSVLRILFSNSRHKEEAVRFPLFSSGKTRGLRGHSFCLTKADILAINGFDEDFNEPYFGEDTDVERRLKLAGVKLKCSRFAALQYHLYHNAGSRKVSWDISEKIYRQKAMIADPVCVNGLDKYLL